MTLTSCEIKALKMLNRDRSGEWGAWVSVTLEHLHGRGLCTANPYTITEAGKAELARMKHEVSHG